jgi:hypothetical protein
MGKLMNKLHIDNYYIILLWEDMYMLYEYMVLL